VKHDGFPCNFLRHRRCAGSALGQGSQALWSGYCLSQPSRVLIVAFAALVLLFSVSAPVDAKLYINLDNPNLARMPIAIPDFISDQPGTMAGKELTDILRHDLYMTGLFHIIDSLPPGASNQGQQADFDLLNQEGTQALIKGKFSVHGDQLSFEARLYDVATRKMEIGKRFSGRLDDRRVMIHKFADHVMELLTGIRGCFSTRIAFVGASRNREIFSMDFDGHRLGQLTQTGTIVMSPEWAPNDRSIIFTAYLKGNPDLWSLGPVLP
jgi:TolB protein